MELLNRCLDRYRTCYQVPKSASSTSRIKQLCDVLSATHMHSYACQQVATQRETARVCPEGLTLKDPVTGKNMSRRPTDVALKLVKSEEMRREHNLQQLGDGDLRLYQQHILGESAAGCQHMPSDAVNLLCSALCMPTKGFSSRWLPARSLITSVAFLLFETHKLTASCMRLTSSQPAA